MADTPFDFIQDETRRHRERHHCGAYTFEDGAGLIALARAQGGSRALELGTALGYTACCLASAGKAMRVDTIEGDPEHVALARENIAQAGLTDRVTVHRGDFIAVMECLDGGYDIAFFDGFAPDMRIVRWLRDLLRPGGLLVCANLGMVHGDGATELADALADASRWQAAGAIEDGRTLAFRRL